MGISENPPIRKTRSPKNPQAPGETRFLLGAARLFLTFFV
jgi:hypothetical protein